MPFLPVLERFLEIKQATYKHKVHDPAYTARELASAAHVPPHEVAKVVIVSTGEGYQMIVLPANTAVDLAELRTALGSVHARLATEKEIGDLFPDCELGAMPPFGNLYRMPVYADSLLAQDEWISFNAGTHRDVVQMRFEEYQRLVNPAILPLARGLARVSRILLPVDFSDRSQCAVRYALPFAAHFHAEMTLLHVVPPQHEFGIMEAGGAAFAELIAERRTQAEKHLNEFMTGELAGTTAKRVLLEGDPAQEIVDFAHRQQCDWIVMPTHGYGPFRRLLLGSVTAKVLHDADCAVWTGVHIQDPPCGEKTALRHILCAVNLNASSTRVLGWAAHLAREFRACLTVVHVLESLLPGTEGYLLSPEWRRELTGRAQADLAALQRRVAANAAVLLLPGDAAETICGEVKRVGADLLVIGRSSERGILGRLSERAYAIIRQSPCPVVSV